ncbi:MAG: T9SS type A sorting domain-containing protein [Actinobacteria bacterium]|nr:T9SS type A sorting domain-containing protein [Actinomycetota bacterium]
MERKIFLCFLLFYFANSGYGILAQEINANKIDSLKTQQTDMPTGFILFQERIAKPGASPEEQIIQLWRRETNDQDLLLVEETVEKLDQPGGSSISQIWYRGDKNEEKDKIEIEIVICFSQEEIEKTVTYFTTEAFSNQFEITASPFAGEKSWEPIIKNPNGDSFSVMFLRYNVFVRLYVRLENEKELQQASQELADKIDNKILLLTTSTPNHEGRAAEGNKAFELGQNWPNPFNSSTTIRYVLPKSTHVVLKVFDISGREIVTLVNTEMPAGMHTTTWNSRDRLGREVSSGVYFYRLQFKDQIRSGKMILMR